MRIAASFVLILALAGCGAAAPGGSVSPTGAPPTDGTIPTGAPPPPGGWSGTITFHLVRNIDTTETSTSGEGTFAVTTTTHFELQTDVTDTFTVTGSDPEDLEFGIGSVDLTGQAANAGQTLQRTVYESDKHNSLGCHYIDETGSEIDGSWTLGGLAAGGIDFQDDGTYRISVGGGDPGEEAIDNLLWQTYTILEGAANDCPPPGRSEVTGFGQYGEWAYSYGPGDLEGTLNPANPGSVLDGTMSIETDGLEGTVTATWHLVHDGPIILPHE